MPWGLPTVLATAVTRLLRTSVLILRTSWFSMQLWKCSCEGGAGCAFPWEASWTCLGSTAGNCLESLPSAYGGTCGVYSEATTGLTFFSKFLWLTRHSPVTCLKRGIAMWQVLVTHWIPWTSSILEFGDLIKGTARAENTPDGNIHCRLSCHHGGFPPILLLYPLSLPSPSVEVPLRLPPASGAHLLLVASQPLSSAPLRAQTAQQDLSRHSEVDDCHACITLSCYHSSLWPGGSLRFFRTRCRALARQPGSSRVRSCPEHLRALRPVP